MNFVLFHEILILKCTFYFYLQDQMRSLDMIKRDPELASLTLIQAPLVDVEIRGVPALKFMGDMIWKWSLDFWWFAKQTLILGRVNIVFMYIAAYFSFLYLEMKMKHSRKQTKTSGVGSYCKYTSFCFNIFFALWFVPL